MHTFRKISFVAWLEKSGFSLCLISWKSYDDDCRDLDWQNRTSKNSWLIKRCCCCCVKLDSFDDDLTCLLLTLLQSNISSISHTKVTSVMINVVLDSSERNTVLRRRCTIFLAALWSTSTSTRSRANVDRLFPWQWEGCALQGRLLEDPQVRCSATAASAFSWMEASKIEEAEMA